MKKIVLHGLCMLFVLCANSQSIATKLQQAVKKLSGEPQMKYASMSLYVVDQKTGTAVFNYNGQTGLVPASTQKVVTAAAAFELLGTDYIYQTEMSYDGSIEGEVLNGNLYIMGYGDPTLGSDRYAKTKEAIVLAKWMQAIAKLKIKKINGTVVCFDKTWSSQTIPGGWIWDDIGNYFGAGAAAINWNENAYDIFLKSGNKEGDPVSVVSMSPPPADVTFVNEITVGKIGSGDNAWIYLPPYSSIGYLRGTIPPDQKAFKIAGSFPDPSRQLRSIILEALKKNGIVVSSDGNRKEDEPAVLKILNTHVSPTLDSIVYWFMRKSINLYGEALVKTIGFVIKNEGSTDAGIKLIRNFWKEKGIDPGSLVISDGSGLSPTNRVTTEALVNVMQYAKSRPWYNPFYNALPSFNGIKMKSGTMTGVKSFTGYVNGYSFAFIINNYSGSSSEITGKMYAVLDAMK